MSPKMITFSSAIPNNAITFPAGRDSPPTCDHCGTSTSANKSCAACPPNEKTYYCSKECQKADWSVHKPYCKSKQLYAALVDVDPSSSNMDNPLFAACTRIDANATLNLCIFLRSTLPSQRPRTMLPHAMTLREDLRAAILTLASNTTPAAHNARVLPLHDTLYKGVRKHHIPITDRTFDDGDGQNVGSGLQVYPCDMEVVSIGMWERMWGNGKDTWINPLNLVAVEVKTQEEKAIVRNLELGDTVFLDAQEDKLVAQRGGSTQE